MTEFLLSTEDCNTGTEATQLQIGLDDEQFEFPSIFQRISYALTNPGKNYLIPRFLLRSLLKTSRSPLIAESFVRPGGWRSMEIVYKNAPTVDWLDRQALRDNPITMAARNRRKIVIKRLTRLIQQQSTAGEVRLLGIGAGPGRLLQTAMANAKTELTRVSAYLIDLDADAFHYSRELAASFGLLDQVRFIPGDARHIEDTLPGVSIHVAKLVGIIEYLDDLQLNEMLRALRAVMVSGGSLVTHGFVDKYGTGRFFARVFGLNHHQRDAEYLTNILESNGFRVTECEYEPAGIHPIITAVRVD